MFLKGNGEILVFHHKPHITLIGDINLPESKLPNFARSLEKVLENQKSFFLNPLGIGDYDQDFTFYIEFEQNPNLTSIFKKVLFMTRKYITKEKYKIYVQRTYIPHTTILYDNIEAKKVKRAKKMLNKDLFKQPIKVREIELWTLKSHKQINCNKIPLA